MFKPILLAVLLLGAAATAPAFAFTYEAAPTNPDGSAKFSDPDNLADSMADGLSGGSASSTGGYLHMFGSDNVNAGVGIARSDIGTVTSHGTLERPYDPNDPTTHP
jgi:hypothetical protein